MSNSRNLGFGIFDFTIVLWIVLDVKSAICLTCRPRKCSFHFFLLVIEFFCPVMLIVGIANCETDKSEFVLGKLNTPSEV